MRRLKKKRFPPDFRGPRETLGEVDPLSRGSERRRGRWRLDDDVAVQGVHLALDPAVCVLGVLLLVPRVVVLERIPLVVCVQAVLLDQGLGGAGQGGVGEEQRTSGQLHWHNKNQELCDF